MPIDAAHAAPPVAPLSAPVAVAPAAKTPGTDTADAQTARATAEAQIDRLLGEQSTRLDFHVDPATQDIVLQVIDRRSGSVLYQVPSEVALALAVSLGLHGGNLVDTSA